LRVAFTVFLDGLTRKWTISAAISRRAIRRLAPVSRVAVGFIAAFPASG